MTEQVRKMYSREFKNEAVRLLEERGTSIVALARDLNVHPNLLYKWRKQILKEGDEAFRGQGQRKARDKEVRRLRRENALLREEQDIIRASAHLLDQGKRAAFRFIHENTYRWQVKLMCTVLGVSRSGFYAWRERKAKEQENPKR
jgi:transposase